MPKLTDEERNERARQRAIDKAREYSTTTYVRKFVAPTFQKMIRAEFGADLANNAPAVVDGRFTSVARRIGQCVCVTCGKVDWWDSGIKGIHTGHFIPSRCNSILLEEDNVAPQCSGCNFYRSGAPQAFRIWMENVRGEDVIDALYRLKNTSRSFDREELVDMKLAFAERLKLAQIRMRDAV